MLRFWESKFPQVKPIKRAGGRRYYRPADMLLLGGIRKLLHDDGMSIKEVQAILRDLGISHVSEMSHSLDAASPGEQAEGAGGGSGSSPGSPVVQEDAEQSEPTGAHPAPKEDALADSPDPSASVEATAAQAAEDASDGDSQATEASDDAPFAHPDDAQDASQQNLADTDAAPSEQAFSTAPQDDLTDTGQDMSEAQSEGAPVLDQADMEPIAPAQEEAALPDADVAGDAAAAPDTEMPDAPVETVVEAATDPGSGEAAPVPEQFMMDLGSPEPMAPAEGIAPSAPVQDPEITAASPDMAAPQDVAPQEDAEPVSMDPYHEDLSSQEPAAPDTAAGDPVLSDSLDQGAFPPAFAADEQTLENPALSGAPFEEHPPADSTPLEEQSSDMAPLAEDDSSSEPTELTAPASQDLLPSEDAPSGLPEVASAPLADAAPLAAEPEAPASEPAFAASSDPVADNATEAKPRIITVADEDLAAQVSLRPGIFSILAQTTEIPPHVHSDVAACAAELRAWLGQN